MNEKQANPFESEREMPNAEPIAALNEYDEMKINAEKYRRYSSFKEALEDV